MEKLLEFINNNKDMPLIEALPTLKELYDGKLSDMARAIAKANANNEK